MRIVDGQAVKLWIPYNGIKWPSPRLLQLLQMYICKHEGHRFSGWRIDDYESEMYGETPLWSRKSRDGEFGIRVCLRGCGKVQYRYPNE